MNEPTHGAEALAQKPDATAALLGVACGLGNGLLIMLGLAVADSSVARGLDANCQASRAEYHRPVIAGRPGWHDQPVITARTEDR